MVVATMSKAHSISDQQMTGWQAQRAEEVSLRAALNTVEPEAQPVSRRGLWVSGLAGAGAIAVATVLLGSGALS